MAFALLMWYVCVVECWVKKCLLADCLPAWLACLLLKAFSDAKLTVPSVRQIKSFYIIVALSSQQKIPYCRFWSEIHGFWFLIRARRSSLELNCNSCELKTKLMYVVWCGVLQLKIGMIFVRRRTWFRSLSLWKMTQVKIAISNVRLSWTIISVCVLGFVLFEFKFWMHSMEWSKHTF